jgi:pyruvate dehydrogenase E2 component (dihydrolipoamide acetyltransferase)
MPEIQMPKLSDTMTEGTLIAWKKKKGEKVSAGEVVAEIETDKATMEWESPEDGVLTEIYVEEGGKVNVGDRIAFVGSEGETVPAPAKKEPVKAEANSEPAPLEVGKKEKKPSEPKKAAVVASVDAQPIERGGETRIKASPIARRIAAEQGIDISTIEGSGPAGRVTESDVRAVNRSGSPSGVAPRPTLQPGQGARINLTGMRKVIAERLVSSLGPVPHFYLNIEINADPLMGARAELKSAGEGSDSAKITVNDFVLKAAVEAAVRVPKVNASFDVDAIVQYTDVNLAVAIAIEDGLVTPVIRSAQNKSLREISSAVKDLAHRARNKRMKPEEFQGGTFTVSNLGGYGIDNFSAIINPPQGFILSIGAIVTKAIVHGDQVVAGQRMSIGMSCDHRVIDGALGAEYLKELRHLLENPTLLLI